MKQEIINIIKENELSIFEKSQPKFSSSSIFKTKDAKNIYQKVLTHLADNFCLATTKNILKLLNFSKNQQEIEKRQNFFQNIEKKDNLFFKNLKKDNELWKPDYDAVVVTEDESALVSLKKKGCPVVYINQQSDIANLDRYDLIQVLYCDNFHHLLERLPQTVFIDSLDEAFLERYLVELSSWKNIIESLKNSETTQEITSLLQQIESIFPLLNQNKKILDQKDLEFELESLNEKILEKIKEMTLSGESVVSIISKGIPKEIQEIINKEIKNSQIPEHLLEDGIPLKLSESEMHLFLKKQSTIEFTDSAALIKNNSEKIKKIPEILNQLEIEIIYQDFISGISKFMNSNKDFPIVSEVIEIIESKNIFLDKPQPISFNLTQEKRCSILTGANSGGKTTLLEHLVQIIALFNLGLSISGKAKLPFINEIYYFAKNKGSMSKGAFETLLSNLADISPRKNTLILADEIEAVTEPGVAGEIIVSTAEYFIEKDCFLVIATHLGQEVQHLLPEKCRIDGIEAKGLTDNYELIVDRNPVLGKLANSTPELIVERMAKSQQKPYFNWLFDNLKKRKN